MKKYLSIILLGLIILNLSGCKKNDTYVESSKDSSKEEEKIPEEEVYTDENPIKLGLFLYNGSYNNKERIDDTHYTNFVSGSELGSYEVFLTDEKVVNGTSFQNVWKQYADNYSDINYKVGFNIKFILEDGTDYNANFLEPDIYKFGDYFYVYLYDDVNQVEGTFYSHLEEMKEDTILSSIKIVGVDGIDKVGNIILSAFTYDGLDDFDEDGNYRGNSRYVIRIKKNS